MTNEPDKRRRFLLDLADAKARSDTRMVVATERIGQATSLVFPKLSGDVETRHAAALQEARAVTDSALGLETAIADALGADVAGAGATQPSAGAVALA